MSKLIYTEGEFKVYVIGENSNGESGPYWNVKYGNRLICICHNEIDAEAICHALAVVEQINS